LTAAIRRHPAGTTFQRFHEWRQHERRADARQRAVRLVETDIRQPRDDLGTDSNAKRLRDDQPVGARQRLQHRGLVSWLQAAEIGDLPRRRFFCQDVGGGGTDRHHRPIGTMVTSPLVRVRAQPIATGRRLRQIAFGGVKRLVLDPDTGSSSSIAARISA
jgi:hypothetical protein